MGRKKAKDEENEEMPVIPIDRDSPIKARDLVKLGLQIIKHEIDQLADKAERNLLGIQEARLLTDYVSTAIRIAKDITLEEDELSEDDIKTMSVEELTARTHAALKRSGHTPEDLIFDPKGGKKSGHFND